TASTSAAITVGNPFYTAATGGSAISADTAGASFTSLGAPTYSEAASGSVGAGTMILKTPAGFDFDTGGTAPGVVINRLTGSGSSANNISGVAGGTTVAMSSVTATQMVFTVTSPSANGITCGLVWTNVRVRPISGTPLARGNLYMAGTAS